MCVARIPAILSPEEAVKLIPDRARVAITGFASAGVANSITRAMMERFRKEQSPKELTVYHAAGHVPEAGADILAAEPMIAKIVGGHWGVMKFMRERIMNNDLEAHNWPQGMIVRAFREAASGNRFGHLSRVGLGTFIDPRQLGGCVNPKSVAAGTMISLEHAPDGSELLRYSYLPIDVALVRGWKADKYGNVYLGNEPTSCSILETATAAKTNGGRVFCQVREYDPELALNVRDTALPGFLIDGIVICPNPEEEHRQCIAFNDSPSLLGGNQEPTLSAELPPVPPGPRGWIGRRAALEIKKDNLFNLGIGIPGEAVAPALAESGRLMDAVPTLESGVIGGVGLGNVNFGITVNPYARIDQGNMFDLYHAGGLDVAVMGAAEIDPEGNINVSQFGSLPTGCGGFIDITQHAKKIVFCSTLTSGKFDAVYEDGVVKIISEGKFRKFLKRVRHATDSRWMVDYRSCARD